MNGFSQTQAINQVIICFKLTWIIKLLWVYWLRFKYRPRTKRKLEHEASVILAMTKDKKLMNQEDKENKKFYNRF